MKGYQLGMGPCDENCQKQKKIMNLRDQYYKALQIYNEKKREYLELTGTGSEGDEQLKNKFNEQKKSMQSILDLIKSEIDTIDVQITSNSKIIRKKNNLLKKKINIIDKNTKVLNERSQELSSSHKKLDTDKDKLSFFNITIFPNINRDHKLYIYIFLDIILILTILLIIYNSRIIFSIIKKD